MGGKLRWTELPIIASHKGVLGYFDGIVSSLVGDPDQVGGEFSSFWGRTWGNLGTGLGMRLNDWWGIRIWLEESCIPLWDPGNRPGFREALVLLSLMGCGLNNIYIS